MTSFKSLTCFSLLAVLVLFLSASPVQAKSFWDAIMGRSGDESAGPPPEKTLQAPFIDPNSKSATTQDPLMDIYEKGGKDQKTGHSTLDIDQPHRSPEAIAEWGSGIVVEALTFSPDTFDPLQKSLTADFSDYGIQEYQTYTQKMGLLETLKRNNLKLISISNGGAQVLREGVVSGTYHWLVQVPVMASFYDQKISRIVDKRAKIAQNQEILIQVQIGRTQKKNKNELGIEIERWIVVGR